MKGETFRIKQGKGKNKGIVLECAQGHCALEAWTNWTDRCYCIQTASTLKQTDRQTDGAEELIEPISKSEFSL